ncbi:acyl-CoA dehydratase activase-related protein [Streptomyces sp. YIM S03343]
MAALHMGLDVGSTTIKLVLMDDGVPVFEDYRRHNADVQVELARLFKQAEAAFPGRHIAAAVTGSAGLGIADRLGLPFVQEVIAGTEAIRRTIPQADVVIELGGEDAKITYLKPAPEQRMNGSCAGGTGAFIDQMATLLHTDALGLDELASRHRNLYQIASRCGVFAKSDLQPLINEGAPSEDLAASIFQAVATQTIAGLACGRPIRGTVVFLGGPLHFLPRLREAFQRLLAGSADAFITPPDAQLYVARGAAYLAEGEPLALAALAERLRTRRSADTSSARMPALFADDAEREAFDARHATARVPQLDISQASGPCFLGIDAGSTTIKAVVIDDRRRIVFSHYATNGGDPVRAAVDIVRTVRRSLPGTAVLARSCATGYGESLIKAALHVDDGEIETMAHYRAAEYVCPGVSCVIDIGGQDMKFLRVRDGVIDSISVNEACSSGCGSFLQTFAETMGLDIESFTAAALASFSPVDLGSRCTVFMNSSVKQAQKEGASVGDISAGLSYAVVRNALYKVIKLRDPAQLGEKVVVQGGTFLNDAVLRAFELLTGRQVVRPDISGLMGAFGAALIARSNFVPGHPGRLLSAASLGSLRVQTSAKTCSMCQNHCQCTVSTFNDGRQHVSGNRCERGADESAPKSPLPNLFDYTYKRLFGYRRLTAAKAHRGDIGIPRVLNLYENYPLWFTTLTALGFRVIVSGRSSHEVFEKGMESIASENVCYPAKLAHGHILSLLERGVRTVFYPSVFYEQELTEGADNHFNCPVVTSYPQVIANNIEQLRADGVRFLNPFLNLANRPVLARRLAEVFAEEGVTEQEAAQALDLGFAEDAKARADIRAEGARALDYMAATGTRGIVLAGRPYHVDPEVHHGIPELITGLGMAVLTEDSVLGLASLERPLRVRDQWAYHSRLYEAAAMVAGREDLQLVQLNSFGCGLDAITSDQVAEILEAQSDVYTTLKIDEVSSLGAARIRLRSLAAATRERTSRAREAEHTARVEAAQVNGVRANGVRANGLRVDGTSADGVSAGSPGANPSPAHSHVLARVPFTRRMRREHTIIAPQMSPIHFRLLQAALRRCGYRIEILETASPQDIDAGLGHVNNDACYPAVLVVGQLVNAFATGRYDPETTSVMISQTGGMCRATNYTGLLRKGLEDAGYGHVPVLAVSTGGIEKNPGFSLSLPLIHRALQAVVLGDLLQHCLLRVRPYEAVPGSAAALYERWNAIVCDHLEHRRPAARGRRRGYARLIESLVDEFDRLPLLDGPRKPRIGIVGEILVKFHPDANNHLIDTIESEGCEAVLPGLAEFVFNDLYVTEWNHANLGTDTYSRWAKKALRRLAEVYRRPVRRALSATGGKFPVPGDLALMAQHASAIASLGNQAGEGWLLTAEILHLLADGVPNVICAQPFACLPNHVTGKGMFQEIRRRHPHANITAIDYDPGASEVNQLNRIKLVIASARLQATAPDPLLPTGSPLPGHTEAPSGAAGR